MHHYFAWRKNRHFINLASIVAGGISVLAFEPFNYSICSIISVIALLYIWHNSSVTQSCYRGFLYGLGLFGFGVSWVYVSINTYSDTPWYSAAGFTGLFVIFLSLFPALLGYVYRRLFKYRRFLGYLTLPFLWILVDALRGIDALTGFPWLFLGYSQTHTPLLGYAPLIGVYGVTALVLYCSILIYCTSYVSWLNKLICLILVICIYYTGDWLKTVEFTTPVNEPLSISLIQSNIAQELKWKREHLLDIVGQHLVMTDKQLGRNIIVWPEAALTWPLPYSQPVVDYINRLGKQYNSIIMFGAPERVSDNEYYNSLIAVGANSGIQIYRKQHLAPFGDFVPLDHWLRGIIDFFNLPMSNFIPGEEQVYFAVQNDDYLAGFICYEIAFPRLVFRSLPRANGFIVVSNDTWFGHSIGPHQHLQITAMRAAETGRYIARATNNGITAIIDQHGNIIGRIPQFTEATLSGSLQGYAGMTPIVRLGLTTFWFVTLAICLFLLSIRRWF